VPVSQVVVLQNRLNFFGGQLPITGIYDDCTDATLQAFREQNGIARPVPPQTQPDILSYEDVAALCNNHSYTVNWLPFAPPHCKLSTGTTVALV
jgi:hypothetical protein